MSENYIKDRDAREKVLNPKASYILQAPAGSGKTKLLIDRYLTLLAQVQTPEEIIAITFTRKAASEMKERVLNVLLSPDSLKGHTKALVKKVLAQNVTLNWGLTENMHRFRILTIDALAYSFAQQFPQFFELSQSATITEDSDYYYQMAVNQLWLNTKDLPNKATKALKIVLLHFNNRFEKLEGLLVEILKSREQWLYPIVSHLNDSERLKTTVEESLKNIVLETIQLANDAFPCSIKEPLWNIITSISHRLPSDHPLQKAQFSSPTFPEISSDALHLWRAIANFLLTKEGIFKKRCDKKMGFKAQKNSNRAEQEKKEMMKSILDQLRPNALLESRLKSVIDLPDVRYAPAQWKIIKALIEILPMLVAELNLVFQQHAVVDFIEINLSALRALGSLDQPSDLALYLDYQIKHILVDEFQDTSIIHFHLLEKIIEGWQEDDGRTLFVVGDPMQSIYRFRQAEVGLFLKVQQQGISHLSLKPMVLNTNFRAHYSLVEWVNQNFQTIFPIRDELTKGSIGYRPFVAIDRSEKAQTMGVHCHAFYQNNLNDKLERIASLIQRYRQENQDETIAILVRSRRQVVQLLPYLQTKNINYQATELQSFSKNPIIRDLMTLLQAMLFQHDQLAWFALLRTPFCGLLLSDLLVIAQKMHLKNETTVWQILQTSLLNISSDGKARINKFVPILATSFKKRSELILSDWIRMTWFNLNGALVLRDKTDSANVQHWFDLLCRLDQETENFSFKKLKSVMEGRYINTGMSNTRVDIMTIHKSKGLEFDHVILPELNQSLPVEKDQLMQLLNKPRLTAGEDFIIAPSMPYAQSKSLLNTYLRKIEIDKSYDEAKRLLYVAVTRAKKSVHLMARLNIKNNKIVSPSKRSFLGMLWPLNQEEFIASLEKKSSKKSILDESVVYERLPLTQFQCFEPFTKKPEIFHTLSLQMPNEFARIVGIVFHEILQDIGETGIERWSLDQWNKKKSFYHKRLRQWQLNSKKINDAVQLIDKSIKSIIKDPKACWLLSNKHKLIQQEYALSTQSNGKLLNIIIDRTFIDNNIRWIIDYKTTHYLDDVDNKLEKYKSQLKLYQSIMKKFDPIHPIKTGIYFTFNCRWIEF